MKHETEKQLPETQNDFNKKYFNIFGNFNEKKLSNDIQGYISYYDIEDNVSLFAKKEEVHLRPWAATQNFYLKVPSF